MVIVGPSVESLFCPAILLLWLKGQETAKASDCRKFLTSPMEYGERYQMQKTAYAV